MSKLLCFIQCTKQSIYIVFCDQIILNENDGISLQLVACYSSSSSSFLSFFLEFVRIYEKKKKKKNDP
jgi:hypothetical protein